MNPDFSLSQVNVSMPKSRSARRLLRSDHLFALLLVVPTFLIVFVLIIYPVAFSFWTSLNDVNLFRRTTTFVGLGNYAKLFDNPLFADSMRNTLAFSVSAVFGAITWGLAMALILNERLRARNLVRSLVLIPWAMAPVVIGILWSWIYSGQYGTLNALLYGLGIIDEYIPWLASPGLALPLVTLTYIWNYAPVASVLILAALQSVPPNLYRAAQVDGANAWSRFVHITLPWLRPTLLLVIVLATIDAVMHLALIYLMTRGGPGTDTTVFAWLGYTYLFQLFKQGEGSAMLYTLTLICLGLAFIYIRLLFRRNKTLPPTEDESAAGPLHFARLSPKIGSGFPRTPVTLPIKSGRLTGKGTRRAGVAIRYLLLLFVAVWSALPFLLLITFSLSSTVDLISKPPPVISIPPAFENYTHLFFPGGIEGEGSARAASFAEDALRVPGSLAYSFTLAITVVLFNLIIGSLAGYAYARYSHLRFMSLTFPMLLVTRMIPGLVILLPFYLFFTSLKLIGSIVPLIITYSAFILPMVVWMLRGYFETIPISLERAALVDGCSRLGVLRRVILPLSLPGLVAVGTFAFMAVWNEFMYALILGGSQTMSLTILTFADDIKFSSGGYGILFASGVLGVLPAVIFALFFQRFLIQGLTSGAAKG